MSGLFDWLRRPAALRGCDLLGPSPSIRGSPRLQNGGRLEIGARFSLDCRSAPTHLVVAQGGALVIGDDVAISHGCGLAAHGRIELGDGVRLGPFVLIMDTSFHRPGDHDRAPAPRPVRIGAGALLGAHVTVLPGCTIGAGARVLPRSVVTRAVPPGGLVSGVPGRAASPARFGGGLLAPAEVVRRTFGLPSLPDDDAAPEQIAGWDSLGSLQLLLALEDAYSVRIEAQALAAVRSVAGLGLQLEQAVPVAPWALSARASGPAP